jgi:hypothetical protein
VVYGDSSEWTNEKASFLSFSYFPYEVLGAIYKAKDAANEGWTLVF